MNQNDMTYSKFSTLKTFMKAKIQPSQQTSFRIQSNYDQKLIKKQVAKSMRSKNKQLKYQSNQKASKVNLRSINESLSTEKIDRFRSISIVLNQQNVNLNQQKNFLLNQIRLLQEKDKKRKIQLKQLKQRFKVLQKDYFQLQKLNLSLKYKCQALNNIVQNFYKKDSQNYKNQEMKNKYFDRNCIQDNYQQKIHQFNYQTSLEQLQNYQYLKNLQISSIKSIQVKQKQKPQHTQEKKEHFPLSLKQINKNLSIGELFQILQKKFETLLIEYRLKMDQHIKKQYRQISKCIKCVRTCLEQHNSQKLSKTTLNVLNNAKINNCYSKSEQQSTNCFRSRQQEHQHTHQDAISFEKYIP